MGLNAICDIIRLVCWEFACFRFGLKVRFGFGLFVFVLSCFLWENVFFDMSYEILNLVEISRSNF